MKNKKLMLIPMLILVFALLAGTALAAGDLDRDTAGNLFLGGDCDETNGTCVSTDSADRDIYWAGRELDLSGSSSGNDALVAGYKIAISDSSFGGSIRAAGYSVDISGTKIGNNITAAGQSITVGSGTEAAGVIIVGNEIKFDGTADSLTAAGAVVTVNGTVNGDANIDAGKVVFGDDAVITGTLKLTAEAEPEYPAGIKNVEFTKSENDENVENVAKVAAGAAVGAALLERIYWIFANVVTALLLCLLAAPELKKSGETLLAHPVAMPVTGLVTLCAMPVALILCCCFVITAPAGGLIAILFSAICLFSIAFAGASAGRLVFPKMNAVLASVVGTAIISLLRVVPYLGGLLLFACIIYTVGYFILACYERIKALKKQPEAAAVETAPTSEN